VLLRLIVALVLAGLGLLLAGFARDALGLIYLSILCTGIAGVALIVYVQVTRRQSDRLATERLGEDDAGGDEQTGRGQSAVDTAEGGGRGALTDPAAVTGGSTRTAPDADVEPPAGSGGRQGSQAVGANPDPGTDQPQPGAPPGTAPGEEAPPAP
jgi:hypothetical protein